jgi:hypothetical protein
VVLSLHHRSVHSSAPTRQVPSVLAVRPSDTGYGARLLGRPNVEASCIRRVATTTAASQSTWVGITALKGRPIEWG